MSFRNIIGQDSAVGFLKGSIANDRVGHAYIFLGPKGVGKRLAAINFAKALNCQSLDIGESCDGCPSCRKIDASNHPDVSIVKQEEDATSIKIDAIRALIKDINLKPYEGKKKVYIIEEADSMRHEAANSLLKTLEAPPSDAVIILLVENLNMLFQTIVSRSQVVRFFPLGVDVVMDILITKYSVEEPKARILSHLSNGKLGEALEYREKDVLDIRETVIRGMMKRSIFDIVPEKAPREDVKMCLDIMLTWYRDIMASKAGLGPDKFINADKSEDVLAEASNLSMEYVNRVIDQVMMTSLYLDQNANAKLAMGVLASRVAGRK